MYTISRHWVREHPQQPLCPLLGERDNTASLVIPRWFKQDHHALKSIIISTLRIQIPHNYRTSDLIQIKILWWPQLQHQPGNNNTAVVTRGVCPSNQTVTSCWTRVEPSICPLLQHLQRKAQTLTSNLKNRYSYSVINYHSPKRECQISKTRSENWRI